VGFQQATIPIEKKPEFELLRDAIDKAYAPPRVEKFLGSMKSKGINSGISIACWRPLRPGSSFMASRAPGSSFVLACQP